MTLQIPNPVVPGVAPQTFARHVATIIGRKKIHITVLSPACTISVDKEPTRLENPGPVGIAGTPLTTALGATELEWEGELWAYGVIGNALVPFVEFDIP